MKYELLIRVVDGGPDRIVESEIGSMLDIDATDEDFRMSLDNILSVRRYKAAQSARDVMA